MQRERSTGSPEATSRSRIRLEETRRSARSSGRERSGSQACSTADGARVPARVSLTFARFDDLHPPRRATYTRLSSDNAGLHGARARFERPWKTSVLEA